MTNASIVRHLDKNGRVKKKLTRIFTGLARDDMYS